MSYFTQCFGVLKRRVSQYFQRTTLRNPAVDTAKHCVKLLVLITSIQTEIGRAHV